MVKSIARFMIYVVYNSKLEQSFLMDKCADFVSTGVLNKQSLLGDADMLFDSADDVLLRDRSSKKSENNSNNNNNNSINIVINEKNKEKSANESKETNDALKVRRGVDLMQEINVNESPLEQTSYESMNEEDTSNDKTAQQSEYNSSSEPGRQEIQKQQQQLTLTICEQYKEKSAGTLTRNFKLLIDELYLCVSPFVAHKLPFLISESSNTDQLKVYLPKRFIEHFNSSILKEEANSVLNSYSLTISSNKLESATVTNNNNGNIKSLRLHEFLQLHLTKSFDDDEIRRLYADFKSRGGIALSMPNRRLFLSEIENLEANDTNGVISGESTLIEIKRSGLQASEAKYSNAQKRNKLLSNISPTNDCLDILNRQHIAVLFYSQCESSPVYPNICHKPRIINMNFYGENDMTLGNHKSSSRINHIHISFRFEYF
jgi:hypothetical protein